MVFFLQALSINSVVSTVRAGGATSFVPRIPGATNSTNHRYLSISFTRLQVMNIYPSGNIDSPERDQQSVPHQPPRNLVLASGAWCNHHSAHCTLPPLGPAIHLGLSRVLQRKQHMKSCSLQ